MHELIEKRRSPRAYSSRLVEPEKLRELFEAARWAASCFNEQPWRFIYAERDDRENFDRLFDCLSEKNRVWVKDAPLLMVTLAVGTFTHNGKPNRHAWHDVGLAMGNFSLQASALGLYVHQMAGFSPERARENLDIPEGLDPVTMVTVGYLSDAAQWSEELRRFETATRSRKPLDELVYNGVWGEKSGL